MNPSNVPPEAVITIDGVAYSVPLGDFTGHDLRNLVSPPADELWLDVPDAQDVEVGPNETITIAGDLRFFTDKQTTIYINGAPYRVRPGSITEDKLRKVPTPPIPDDHRIWKDIFDELDDPITENEIVLLQGDDRFITKPPLPTTFDVIVNGTKHTVPNDTVSFEQVVALAFPNPPSSAQLIFTVAYSRAVAPRPAGTMRPGNTITVKTGTIFNVTATDKS